MNKITVGLSQTIYDIAMMYYGSVESVMLIVKDNPSIYISGVGPEQYLPPGSVINIRTESNYKLTEVVNFYNLNNIEIATG